ncbi:hypothetical protein PROFUN_05158 [Planoprotostelium fungivorum]|uniref:Uncharacterized protein n=1 Tax=Planoprotostelium fungivorum TaxID=1890364 RepID=A0A2P6NRT5_9EUKA|nr:hypothetical protein PROFUN_05158 [Planoprotostelium fungivorum]
MEDNMQLDFFQLLDNVLNIECQTSMHTKSSTEMQPIIIKSRARADRRVSQERKIILQ